MKHAWENQCTQTRIKNTVFHGVLRFFELRHRKDWNKAERNVSIETFSLFNQENNIYFQPLDMIKSK